MKKLFAILFLAAIVASCDNSANSEQRMKDSLDSITNLKKESINQAAEQAKDTIEQSNDSLKQRIDSVADKTRDSLKK